MAKFRETLWFKRGELVEDATPDDEPRVELPIEDRYLDQGSVTNADSVLFGVHTGETTSIPIRASLPDVADPGFASTVIACAPSSAPELRHLIRELKLRNRTIFAMCGAAMVVVVFVVSVVI